MDRTNPKGSRQAEAELKTRSEAEQVSMPKGKRGPARVAGSKRDVAERTGISPASQVEIESHVTLAERFPFMQAKRRCVEIALHEFSEWSDRRIAEACGVGHPFVGEIRAQVVSDTTCNNSAQSEPATRTGKDGKRKNHPPVTPKSTRARERLRTGSNG